MNHECQDSATDYTELGYNGGLPSRSMLIDIDDRFSNCLNTSKAIFAFATSVSKNTKDLQHMINSIATISSRIQTPAKQDPTRRACGSASADLI